MCRCRWRILTPQDTCLSLETCFNSRLQIYASTRMHVYHCFSSSRGPTSHASQPLKHSAIGECGTASSRCSFAHATTVQHVTISSYRTPTLLVLFIFSAPLLLCSSPCSTVRAGTVWYGIHTMSTYCCSLAHPPCRCAHLYVCSTVRGTAWHGIRYTVWFGWSAVAQLTLLSLCSSSCRTGLTVTAH